MTDMEICVAAAERQLRAGFAAMVGELALPQLAGAHVYVPSVGQQVAHEPLDKFALWPALPNFDEDQDVDWDTTSTLEPAQYDYVVPEATAPHCMHIDAEHAIVLGFMGHAAAYASAGISDEGALRIVQLQGAGPDCADPVAARGRRGGFLWTDTLVEAWATIGSRLGLETVEIHSPAPGSCKHGNGPEHAEEILQKYTFTARRLNFNRPNPREPWRRPIDIRQTVSLAAS